MNRIINYFFYLTVIVLFISCNQKVKQRDEEIYSRHLQEKFKLTVISTLPPNDKSTMNLLLLNDGQDAEAWRIKETVDSLYKAKQIQPLLVVAIHANNRMQEYGVAENPDYENRGNKADKYAEFIDDELYPYIKKNTGTRGFKSVVIAGASLGALSAFDIAWNHHTKIDKVGVFSGSFWWRDKDTKDISYKDDKNRIMLNVIKSSRKKPHLKYWFYAGTAEEDSDRDKDGVIDVIDDTKDLIEIIKSKNVCSPNDIIYKETQGGKHEYGTWAKELPNFLLWAFKN